MNKPWLGIVLIVLGIVFGGFVGIYLCLYGGMVQVINGIKAPWDAVQIAIGIVRVLCTGVAGSLSAFLFFVPGWALFTEDW